MNRVLETTSDASASGLNTRPIPLRIDEPNIIHNPYTWMGVWTPKGWRVHEKRWGQAVRKTIRLSGDGETTFFPGVLRDPDTGRVEWRDDLHLSNDPFTDTGIYPAEPRVEYPAGQPRWQVSHTLMVSPVADHGLYTHEYSWDLTHGHLYTHFRKHIKLEKARTDSIDGRTVRIQHTPISSTIEANTQFSLNNSAVRGVWGDSQKTGPNYYARRIVQKIAMRNAVYTTVSNVPVVQCYGLYLPDPGDSVDGLFDADSGLCEDWQRLQEQLLIPMDLPKLGMVRLDNEYYKVPSQLYESDIWLLRSRVGEVKEADVDRVRERVGTAYQHARGGYAFESAADSSHEGYNGYLASYDLNCDGRIDDQDVEAIASHVGRRVRYNLYQDAYFGGDWLSTSVGTNPEQMPGDPVIADYEYGGGYDSQAGIIHLLDTPGPDEPVWVEYHCDVPAAAGENNIVVHLYQEIV